MTIQHLDTCLPDYFPGHHNTVLQVPVWQDMSKEDLTQAIIDEYNVAWDHYCEFGDWPDLEEKDLRKACDELILTDRPFKDTSIPTLDEYQDEENEDMESIYAYFVWVSE